MDCRKKETTHSFDRLITVYPYTGAYQKLLSAYKFGKSLPLGHFLAEKIMQAYTLFPAGSLTAPVLVPVPPRPGKIKSTGWDQIEYLAQVLERMYRHNPETALPVYRCLKRLSSQTQKHLSRQQRKTNLVGRILCTKAAPRELILFDDVFTTGSTMDVCSAALKASGAQKVYGICLFHT
jgi:ComF family protein